LIVGHHSILLVLLLVRLLSISFSDSILHLAARCRFFIARLVI
jgi:hypothetical protein